MNTFEAQRDAARLMELANNSRFWPSEANESVVVTPISGSGSQRRYYRLALEDEKSKSFIGTIGNDVRENRAFFAMTKHFGALRLPVPELLAVSVDEKAYLQSDAGKTSLYALLSGDNRVRGIEMAGDILRRLPDFQFRGFEGFDVKWCYPVEAMDERAMMWDLNYFKYDFLKIIGARFDERGLDSDFDSLIHSLTLPKVPTALQLRDFQSRNLLVDADSGDWTLIDYQGARRGSVVYDAASFIWQTRANFTDAEKRQFVDIYYDSLCRYVDLARSEFDDILSLTVLLRRLQTLGAYGLRGLVERKPEFMTPLTQTLDQILADDSRTLQRFPSLREGLEDARQRIALRSDMVWCVPSNDGKLTVKVSSFSFKKGYPVDRSGNGGGFVFDCRALANPGRYDCYKMLNGRDPQVIEFLDRHGECQVFVDKALGIVGPSIERYIERGFTHLEIAFGCTGGQHRSLRCADLMAAALRELYDVDIELCHREQNITEFIASEK